MRAMLVRGAAQSHYGEPLLELGDVPVPEIGDHQVLIQVSVCGVCRTDLDVAEGRITAPHYPVIPGHQIVGRIAAAGRNATGHMPGDRVGVAWINSACGVCRWCTRGMENLCSQFRSTGCDADGGYAEYVAAPADFIYQIPEALTDVEAAPLLCAGAIGWRSLRMAGLLDGDPLGLTGFGSSAHIVLQLARRQYPASPVYVFARNEGERDFARQLGAAWAGNTTDLPPQPLAAIIDTTPAWKPIVEGLSHLMPGGRMVVNAIRKTGADQSELLRLDYATHLWMEREVKSVANVTRADVREMLAAAAGLGLRATVETLSLDRANEALARLQSGADVRGATVLDISGERQSVAPRAAP